MQAKPTGSGQEDIGGDLMDQLCPECGSGTVSRDGRHAVIRLAKDDPFNAECKTCEQRSKERSGELGRKVARDIEEQVLKKVFG